MAPTKVADLTVEEFKELVRDIVVQTLHEMPGDPDEGLELREDFKQELRRSLEPDQEEIQTTSAAKITEKLAGRKAKLSQNPDSGLSCKEVKKRVRRQ